MADFTKFRTSIGGFNRDDVVHYIETASVEHLKELRQVKDANEKLEAEKAALRAELDETKKKLTAANAKLNRMTVEDASLQQQVETLAQEAFEAGRAECGFECVGAPSLIDQKVTEDKELIYTFEVGMYPEVQLGQYKGLEVPQNHEAFDESKVDEEMHNVQKRNARLLDVEREAKMGDHVTIDFAGFIDGEQFDGGTAEDYDLELGSNTFVPGFEEQIVSMKTGDERDVVVTFPENYVEALAGKEATFKVTVKSVKVNGKTVLNAADAATVRATLKDADGNTVWQTTGDAEAQTAISSGPLQGIAPWSAESPTLYELDVDVIDQAGDVIECTSQKVGFRRFRIEEADGKLTADFNTFRVGLRHHHYDTFATEGPIGELPAGLTLTFAANPKGEISTLSVTLGSEKGLQPIVFTK